MNSPGIASQKDIKYIYIYTFMQTMLQVYVIIICYYNN